MTYDELTVSWYHFNGNVDRLTVTLQTFGRLRKVYKLGPYGMFQRLVHEWGEERVRKDGDHSPVLEPRQIAYVILRINCSICLILITEQGEDKALFCIL